MAREYVIFVGRYETHRVLSRLVCRVQRTDDITLQVMASCWCCSRSFSLCSFWSSRHMKCSLGDGRGPPPPLPPPPLPWCPCPVAIIWHCCCDACCWWWWCCCFGDRCPWCTWDCWGCCCCCWVWFIEGWPSRTVPFVDWRTCLAVDKAPVTNSLQ